MSQHPTTLLASIVTAVVVAACLACAQWSGDPGINLSLADRPGEQTQPKVCATSDGGAYVSWFDNAVGGYDVYLQRVDAAGNEQWPHNGLLIADRSFSSTQDYDLDVDGADHALLVFRDDRFAGIQITAVRVAPDATFPWGPMGVQLTFTKDPVAAPKIAATTDGNVVVAWRQGNDTIVQKVDSYGAAQWGAGVTLSDSDSATFSASDLSASDSGSVIIALVRGFLSPTLHAQKLSAAGTPLWGTSPIAVFDGGTLQVGDFPTFVPDGGGGAVFGWYGTGPLQCYVQHILADGHERFPHNGVVASTNASQLRVAPSVSYNAVTGETLLFWIELNSRQSQFGVYGQKFDAAGVRQWGDTGRVLVALGPAEYSQVRNLQLRDGALVLFVETVSLGDQRLLSTRVDGDGQPVEAQPIRVLSSVRSSKSRLAAALRAGEVALLAWVDGRKDAGDVYGQNDQWRRDAGPRAQPAAASEDGPAGSGLPLPSTLPLDEYERLLYDFLDQKRYLDLGWKADRSVRDTGPFIDERYYGPHPAVRIYYSPEVYRWLRAGRPDNGIPDGAMIIKEMYDPPAARYAAWSQADLRKAVTHWTVMAKDRAGSKDGWFWSEYATKNRPDSHDYPFNYPLSGFGQYCLRCHASVNRGKEFTFSSLRNIEGEEDSGDPVIYRVDDSVRTADLEFIRLKSPHPAPQETPSPDAQARRKPLRKPDPEFLRVFDALQPVRPGDVRPIPPVTWDHVVPGPDGPEQFVTSDNCMSCHDGQDTSLGHNMTVTGDHAVNLSPYGEWNWSMMGLAGRDPIFYAQLESEIALHGPHADEIQDICFRCHGVMGQRQFHIDHERDPGEHPPSWFSLDNALATGEPRTPGYKYGALARDGISCTVCHQIVDDGRPFAETVTGKFAVSAPVNGSSRIYGPFENPPTLPMQNALGMTPVYSEYTKSARLCGSCHTIYLPIFDKSGTLVGHDYEQTTYLEWLNSDFRTELGIGAEPRTCQDCHMPDEYRGEKLAFRIANIQDQTYPEADYLAPIADITLPVRKGYRRHTLHGINIFGLEMFNQFDDILGVRKTNYMTGFSNGLSEAILNADMLAKNDTAGVEILEARMTEGLLRAVVKVTNHAGHRFPSGVGFRRAFLEFTVIDAQYNVVWASGQTNSLGIIVDAGGKPLPSEFFDDVEVNGRTVQAYQPHYQIIRRQDEVQIYEELVRSPEGRFTTSFLAQHDTVKDNRLLPRGWTPQGPQGFAPPADKRHDKQWDFPEATMPKGADVLADTQFLDGTGSDVVTYLVDLPADVVKQIRARRSSNEGTGRVSVRATIYYQAIPPSYLKDRFETAKGENGKRLHHLTSHLNLRGTPIEGWKLLVGTAEAIVQ